MCVKSHAIDLQLVLTTISKYITYIILSVSSQTCETALFTKLVMVFELGFYQFQIAIINFCSSAYGYKGRQLVKIIKSTHVHGYCVTDCL